MTDKFLTSIDVFIKSYTEGLAEAVKKPDEDPEGVVAASHQVMLFVLEQLRKEHVAHLEGIATEIEKLRETCEELNITSITSGNFLAGKIDSYSVAIKVVRGTFEKMNEV